MKLITKQIATRLLANGRLRTERSGHTLDFVPVVKLFTPDAGATWLLTDVDPEDPDQAFGLCDLGLGLPELGYVSLAELATFRGRFNLPVERDFYFKPTKTISEYAQDARALGRIRA